MSSIGVDQLLGGLNLFQVGLYPEAEGTSPAAQFDCILGSGITGSILCIRFNDQGEAASVAWESRSYERSNL